MRRLLGFGAMLLALGAAPLVRVHAFPQFLLYQGWYTSDGTPGNGNVPMELRVTNGGAVACGTAANGSTVYWTSGSTAVATTNGLFSYKLGYQADGATQDPAFPGIDWAADRAYYIDVCVDGASLSPKEKIGSGVYAVYAATAAFALRIDTATLSSSGATLQGNSFNAADKLVQLDSGGKLPALDGSQLTNLPTGAQLASTQTFSGAAVFTSSVTFSSSVVVRAGAPELTIQQTSGGMGTFRLKAAGDSESGSRLLIQNGADSTLMALGINGGLGVGTSAPGAALHVNGAALLAQDLKFAGVSAPTSSSGGQAVIYFDSDDSKLKVSQDGGSTFTDLVGAGAKLSLAPSSADADGSANPSIFVNDTGGGNLLQLRTGGSSDLFVVSNAGHVSIGDPSGSLHHDPSNLFVEGVVTSSGSGGSYFAGSVGISTAPAAARLHVSGGGAGDTQLRVDGNAGSAYEPRLVVKADGKVGVGTSSPGAALDVLGDLRVGKSPYPELQLYSVGGSSFALSVGRAAENVFAIETLDASGAAASALRIDSSGKVAIGGASSSSSKLHVAGSFGARVAALNAGDTPVTYSVGDDDFVLLAYADAATLTLNLPEASSGRTGRMLTIKKTGGSGAVVVHPFGGDYIDGSTGDRTIGAYAFMTLIANGSNNWFIINQ